MPNWFKNAFVALPLIVGVGPTGPAQAATDVGSVTASSQSTTDPSGGGTGNYTHADISCTVHQVPVVSFKAWGNSFKPNTRLDVEREVDISGHSGFWIKEENWPFTTATGSWSVPTVEQATLIHGTYTLRVWVYNDRTGRLLGSTTDTCRR